MYASNHRFVCLFQSTHIDPLSTCWESQYVNGSLRLRQQVCLKMEEVSTLLEFGISSVLFVIIVSVIALCVHSRKAKVASSTRRDPKRHLRAGPNYRGKHRINSNRSVISSVVSSNEDLTSYYEVFQLIVPKLNLAEVKTIQENENNGIIVKNDLTDQ
ncbi:uncharacterized protein LOC111131331 [Crassostrea virginica]